LARIDTVIIETGPVAFTSAGIKRPKLGVEGKFSLWFLAALALAEGKVTLDRFTDEKVKDPTLIDLMGKIDARLVRELKFGARVSVRMKDGTEYSAHRAKPKGDPSNPMTFDEIAAKFRSVALLAIPASQADQLIEKVYNLGEVTGMSQLMELTVPRQAAGTIDQPVKSSVPGAKLRSLPDLQDRGMRTESHKLLGRKHRLRGGPRNPED